MTRFQLHLYARKRQPDLEFQPARLRYLLDEWNVISMRRLLDLPTAAKIALVTPFMIPEPGSTGENTLLIGSNSRIAVAA
ncbi:MAG TPA: hypothetical protein VIU36_05740 [Gammaproteobacteria bacterium]|jgi:hypothetical protein